MVEIPEGWYPDPSDLTQERLWDGNAWTTQTRMGTPPPPIPVATPDGEIFPPDEPEVDPEADERAWWSKKRFLIPAALVLLFIFTAIFAGLEEQEEEALLPAETTTTTTTEEPATTTTEVTTTTTEVTTTIEVEVSEADKIKIWRLVVENYGLDMTKVTDESILDVVNNFCDIAEEADGDPTMFGVGLLMVASQVEERFTVEEVSAMAGASIAGWCPEHTDLLGG